MVRRDQLQKLVESESERAWRDSLFELARSLGFDSVLFGAVASKDARLESAFVHSNYSEEWCEHYRVKKFYNVDPTVRHCMLSVLPMVWHPKIFESPEQCQLYETACSFGLKSGISLPLHSPSGVVGLLTLCTRDLPSNRVDEQLRNSMAELSLVRDYVLHSSLKFLGTRLRQVPIDDPGKPKIWLLRKAP